MKLALMQPYFFPYLGYFDLIHQIELWVVFDTAQYIKLGWVNRNRILHPVDSWQYIGVPIRKHSYDVAISSIQIVDDNRWRSKILGKLQHYRKKAPFFNAVMAIVTECLSDTSESLSHLNIKCISRVCEYLEIPFRFLLLSEMKLNNLDLVEKPGDWALQIAEELGASEYINAPGGTGLFDRSRFEKAGIKLTIQKPIDFIYNCDGYEFQPNLSIIDVMMWNSPEDIRNHLISRSRNAQ